MSFFNSKIDSDVFDYCVGNDSIRDTDNMNKIKINLYCLTHVSPNIYTKLVLCVDEKMENLVFY